MLFLRLRGLWRDVGRQRGVDAWGGSGDTRGGSTMEPQQRRPDRWDFALILIAIALIVACVVLVLRGPQITSIFQNINPSL
jgi:hypothetical protein